MILTGLDIKGLKKRGSGKVREIFDLDGMLMIVATDRLSAFDVVMPNGIPDKGRVLTQLSLFWYKQIANLIPSHLITADIEEIARMLACAGVKVTDDLVAMLDGRTMIVRKADVFPVECIVRGYLSGSAHSAYETLRAHSASSDRILVYGYELGRELRESGRLPYNMFTPSTKAEQGEHDMAINDEQLRDLVGVRDAQGLKHLSLSVFYQASKLAEAKGIIIADTKFEFGRIGNKIVIVDEVLTPDSSRFWDAETYEPGGPQPSFDKQFVRNWLQSVGFSGEGTPPTLPEDIVFLTAERYRKAYNRITGLTL